MICINIDKDTLHNIILIITIIVVIYHIYYYIVLYLCNYKFFSITVIICGFSLSFYQCFRKKKLSIDVLFDDRSVK